jgi:hypothetical protein
LEIQAIFSLEFKGSQCNVLIEWKNGEITNEALKVIAADDPVACAILVRTNSLINQAGSGQSTLPTRKEVHWNGKSS